jgi:hypothetical protein
MISPRVAIVASVEPQLCEVVRIVRQLVAVYGSRNSSFRRRLSGPKDTPFIRKQSSKVTMHKYLHVSSSQSISEALDTFRQP